MQEEIPMSKRFISMSFDARRVGGRYYYARYYHTMS